MSVTATAALLCDETDKWTGLSNTFLLQTRFGAGLTFVLWEVLRCCALAPETESIELTAFNFDCLATMEL